MFYYLENFLPVSPCPFKNEVRQIKLLSKKYLQIINPYSQILHNICAILLFSMKILYAALDSIIHYQQ